MTAGQSAYLGGFGITKPTNVLNVELDVEKIIEEKMDYNGRKYPADKIKADPSNYTRIKRQYRAQK